MNELERKRKTEDLDSDQNIEGHILENNDRSSRKNFWMILKGDHPLP